MLHHPPARPRRAARVGLMLLLLGAAATATHALSFTTSARSQVTGLDGWTPQPLFTVGEAVGGYTPPGILDGLGAHKLNGQVVRVYANHELGSSNGYAYTLANGLQLKGARISTFDIDRQTRQLCGAGLAYDKVYDRRGQAVTSAPQISETPSTVNGFSRFCSGAFYAKGERGFADDIYMTGEENANGTQWALDVATRTLWACPQLGRGGWENVSALDSDCKDRIALLMGDDTVSAPLYLYVGRKVKGGSFLERNGLAQGQLYVWTADNGDLTPEDFQGTGATRAGRFLPLEVRDVLMAGQPGHDAQGYLNDTTLRAVAAALGAFRFSRPEDIHTNPRCGTQAVFASTGRGSVYPSDDYGTLYIADLDWARCRRCRRGGDLPETVPATLEILFNAADLPIPDAGIRSPDNLVWAQDGMIYVQEDKSTQLNVFGGVTGREASIWQVDPRDGDITRIAEMDRSAVAPMGSTDSAPLDIGNWETSGIIDVTDLFPTQKGERLLLADVQAHSIRDGLIGGSGNLVEGGQLFLLSRQRSARGRD